MKDKIKIAFLVKRSDALGGTERVASDFFKYLDKDIFEPIILFSRQVNLDRNFEGASFLYMPKESMNSYLKNNKIDVVLIFSYDGLTIDMVKGMRNHSKVLQIVNFTGKYNTIYDANLITTKYDRLKISLLNPKMMKDYVLYHPIDVHKWIRLQKESKGPLVQQEGKTISGRLGRAEPSKWHYSILATLNQCKKYNAFDRHTFVFAGMPKLYQWYIRLFFSKQLKKDQIILYSELRDDQLVSDFYSSLDIFLQSAWIGESFGCVIAEAFAHGCPVITDTKYSIQEGIKDQCIYKINPKLYDAQIELVEEGINGIYADMPKIIFENIDILTKPQIKKLGNAGKQKVLDLYEAKKVTENLQNIILKDVLKIKEYWGKKIYPSKKEIKDFKEEYFKKIKIFDQRNSELKVLNRITYKINSKVFRGIEYIYLAIRSWLRKYLKYDLEECKQGRL